MTADADFEDIRIVGLDQARSSKPDPSLDMYHMYLELSCAPPSQWQVIFDAERRFPRHSMWRKAWVEGGHIVVYCVPEELQRYHLNDLNDDVANANAKYRAYLVERAKQKAREEEKRAAESRRLDEVANGLDFK